ncbi:MAG: SDR family NAD(P)-dependent oxidoreductase [Hyphomonadaceae bacterium]
MSLQGKVAIVTGAARGLGRAYALRLAKCGADVAVVDVNLKGAADFGETLTASTVPEEIRAMGRRSIGIEADLTSRANAFAMAAQVQRELGRIDILVNNAGGATTPVERSRPSQAPEEDIRQTFDINFMSTVFCCQAAAEIMKAQGSGVIINTSSIGGRVVQGDGVYSPYGCSKAAVTHYTRGLAAELGPSGIRANCIAPGIIMTSRVAAQAAARNIGTGAQAKAIPLRRLGEPEDCAGVVEFLASDLSRYVTGQCISACGGMALTAA